ncbi:MAG: lactate utilization protein [Alphaproteobacteria bacterium]|jgi:L-lactate dehydrogenase complex protein LldG|nr:lactate utilization protein [Alphaproteobacteria bacterium]MBT7943656.1 lactate utilization protein [Alphaproteobacteria bacterium]
MSDARSEILGAVRDAITKQVGATPDPQSAAHTQARGRLETHPANLIPARGRLGKKARLDLFIREAERVNATVARVSSTAGVPREVARFLAKNNLPMTLKISPETSEETIPWTEQTLLEVEEGPADGSEQASVSRAFAGVAETGTLVAISGPGNPTTLNFLPPTHVCVVAASEIAGDYEEVWSRLRAEKNIDRDEGAAAGFMPRTVNWITGPSRTADIEQTLLLGAHGPQRLHIVIVDD